MKASTERMINRLVLQFFDDLSPVPLDFEEVENHLENRLREPSTHHAKRALTYLESAGYLADARGAAADARSYKITAQGTRMIRRMVPVDQLDLMLFDGGGGA